MTKWTYYISIPLANKSVVIKTLVVPVLNSFIIKSLLSYSIAPCIEDTTNYYDVNFSLSSSTFCLVLQ